MKKRNIAKEIMEGIKEVALYLEQKKTMEEQLRLKKIESHKDDSVSAKKK